MDRDVLERRRSGLLLTTANQVALGQSSDRHVGIRRIPTQFAGSGVCQGIGLAALLTALVTDRDGPGTWPSPPTPWRQFILGAR